MTNKDIKFPYYSGYIKFTKAQGLVDLQTFIDKQINPKKDIKNILEKVSVETDKIKKRELKSKLFSFTPSVLIRKGRKRKYDNVIEYTCLMQLDFDKFENNEAALEYKYRVFQENNFIVCSYLSPSKSGVKCLARITKPKNKNHYKAIHKAMTSYFLNDLKIKQFDKATVNPMLPLFLSYDPDILYCDISECEEFTKEDWTEINYVRLNDFKPVEISNDKRDHYNKKTVDLFVKKINDIVSDGHTQLRSACLILGSRSGAGYIDKIECYQIAEQLIRSNNYLQKDLQNYINTSKWCIDNGYKNPKSY